MPSSASLQAGLSSYHGCSDQRLCSEVSCTSDAVGKLLGTSHADTKGAHSQLCVTDCAAGAEPALGATQAGSANLPAPQEW